MTGRFTFIDRLVSREHRFSIGLIGGTNEKYLSIPVANQRVDYEEYYRIDDDMFDRFVANPDDALLFVERCRQRREDSRLIFQPGADRGAAS